MLSRSFFASVLTPSRMLYNPFILLATFVNWAAVHVATITNGIKGSPVVHLNYATFKGASTGGVDSFLGVPYAQPPVGDLRFRHPNPPLLLPGVTLVSALLQAGSDRYLTAFFVVCITIRPQALGTHVRNRTLPYLISQASTTPR